jgi:hypothetical protein
MYQVHIQPARTITVLKISMNNELTKNNVVGDKRLRKLLAPHQDLMERIERHLMITLLAAGILEVDQMHENQLARNENRADRGNKPTAVRWDRRAKESLSRWLFQLAAANLSEQEVGKIIALALKRESAYSIEDLSSRENSTIEAVRQAIFEFRELAGSGMPLKKMEIVGTRISLMRRFLTDQLPLIKVAREFMHLSDIMSIFDRMITASANGGRVGGKAAGLLVANAILKDVFAAESPELVEKIVIPESWYITSDVNEEFIDFNRLQEFRNYKYKSIDELGLLMPLLVEIYCNCSFPADVLDQFREMLKDIGECPIIVRSSSLLEDGFNDAFSGMYKSLFLGNQGSLEMRLDALCDAVAEVYACIMAPDPVSYRQSHGLLDYSEAMAVVVQKVVGHQHGHYFLPAIAGVGYSINDHVWSDQLRREDGMARIVLGLGSRAVDRMGDDYPRIISLTAPGMRPEITIDQLIKYAQRNIDVIDLAANSFCTIGLPELLTEGVFADLESMLSLNKDGYLQNLEPNSASSTEPQKLVLTFEKFIESAEFTFVLKSTLDCLEKAYGTPVDIEFIWQDNKLHLLQCRPLARYQDQGLVKLPDDLPAERILFKARGFIPDAKLKGLEWLVYIDPRAWDKADQKTRTLIVKCIGRINRQLAGSRIVYIGPGRWGSSNSDLGVPVNYSDISEACVLVEMMREQRGLNPEASYGTHFYQDLVEDGIYCLPVYLDEDESRFNKSFFLRANNQLTNFLPQYEALEPYLKLIDIPAGSEGRHLSISMDSREKAAMVFLEHWDH